MPDSIYLDHNSTTPMLPEVVAEMLPFFTDKFANSSSQHQCGVKARIEVETAKEKIAHCLDADPKKLIFTSGATEANNLAIHSLAQLRSGTIITSVLEHPSVTEPIERTGREVRHIHVLETGQITDAISTDESACSFVALQLVNHDTGVLQSVGNIAKLIHPIPVHCDATQAVGKMPVSFRKLGVATLTCSAHKFHGPQGIGLLLTRPDIPIQNWMAGGSQQQGTRPGTLPVPLIIGFAKALELAHREMEQRRHHYLSLRSVFLETLQKTCSPVLVNGEETLPHVLNLSFPGCDYQVLLMRLDLAGICCSSGAACTSGSQLPSPAVLAMFPNGERARSSIRFSLGVQQSVELIGEAAQRVSKEVIELRKASAKDH